MVTATQSRATQGSKPITLQQALLSTSFCFWAISSLCLDPPHDIFCCLATRIFFFEKYDPTFVSRCCCGARYKQQTIKNFHQLSLGEKHMAAIALQLRIIHTDLAHHCRKSCCVQNILFPANSKPSTWIKKQLLMPSSTHFARQGCLISKILTSFLDRAYFSWCYIVRLVTCWTTWACTILSYCFRW